MNNTFENIYDYKLSILRPIAQFLYITLKQQNKNGRHIDESSMLSKVEQV